MFSLSGESFGAVVGAKAIRAAHCLTSIQFSPTSQHLLLAYGRCAHLTQLHHPFTATDLLLSL